MLAGVRAGEADTCTLGVDGCVAAGMVYESFTWM